MCFDPITLLLGFTVTHSDKVLDIMQTEHDQMRKLKAFIAAFISYKNLEKSKQPVEGKTWKKREP